MKFNFETVRVTQNKPPTHTLFGPVTQFYLLYTRSECVTSLQIEKNHGIFKERL